MTPLAACYGVQSDENVAVTYMLQVFDESGRDRTPKPMLSMRPTVLRPLPSLLAESAIAGSSSDLERGSLMSEAGRLERLSSAGFRQAQVKGCCIAPAMSSRKHR